MNVDYPGVSNKVKRLLIEGSSQKDLLVNFQNREVPKPHNWMKVVYEAFCKASKEKAYPFNKEVVQFFVCDFLDKVCNITILYYL
jgi:hypothetical protein